MSDQTQGIPDDQSSGWGPLRDTRGNIQNPGTFDRAIWGNPAPEGPPAPNYDNSGAAPVMASGIPDDNSGAAPVMPMDQSTPPPLDALGGINQEGQNQVAMSAGLAGAAPGGAQSEPMGPKKIASLVMGADAVPPQVI